MSHDFYSVALFCRHTKPKALGAGISPFKIHILEVKKCAKGKKTRQGGDKSRPAWSFCQQGNFTLSNSATVCIIKWIGGVCFWQICHRIKIM